VVFYFQPAEEALSGAKAMLDAGALELAEPDEIYALHCAHFPVGTFASCRAVDCLDTTTSIWNCPGRMPATYRRTGRCLVHGQPALYAAGAPATAR
jgi:hypothetical protein